MIDLSPLPEAGQLAGFAGTLERARKNSCEGHLRQNWCKQSRHRPAVLGGRHVLKPRMLHAQAPLRLTMPYEKDPLDRHTLPVLISFRVNALLTIACASSGMQRKWSLPTKLSA